MGPLLQALAASNPRTLAVMAGWWPAVVALAV